MKSLYRRYRPLNLGDVVGQEQVTVPLSNAITSGKINHAYLFIGPRGCGKTSVARILAHQINDFDYQLEDEYVDIIEIDGASNRGIDNIRELREKAAIAPTRGKYKVYIIDEVHMLTKEAFNALLKTLEEPPKHVVFILATTDAYKVPITITSRTQSFVFKLLDNDTMFKYLKNIVKKEKISITDDALSVVVKRGGGSVRDSLSLLDQLSTLSDTEITKDLVISAMGLPEDEMISTLLASYSNGDTKTIVSTYQDMIKSGIKLETLVEELISTIIASPDAKLIPLLSNLSEIKPPFIEAKLLVALTKGFQTIQPTKVLEVETKTSVEAKPPVNHNTAFDYQKFLEEVQAKNDALYSQLLKTKHVIIDNTINIYPQKQITKTILSRNNNITILQNVATEMKIVIHEVSELTEINQKDKVLSAISDIMGGEVINDGGKNPFE